MKKRILFICTANVDRSPTAERIYSNVNSLEVRSAGILASTRKTVSSDLITWADQIFVMEGRHQDFLTSKWPECEEKIVVLDIPDRYLFNESRLIKKIKQKVEPCLDLMKLE